MNFIANGVGAIVFGFHKHVFLFYSNKVLLTRAILDLQGLLFFSTFTFLILFWVEIYHHSLSSTYKFRISYFSINGAIYLIQACIWIYIGVNNNNITELLLFIGKIFIAIVSFIASLGFLIYGGRLFLLLQRFSSIESRRGRNKLQEVGSVTTICFTCFFIRYFMVVLSCFDDRALDPPVSNLIYYMFVEILPSALVLYILRKMPPRRLYHPII